MDSKLKEKLLKIKAVAFDGDGVIFSGRVFISPEKGESFKERSHVDGQGISLLRAAGIKIAFVTGEKSGFLEALAQKLNSLPSVTEGRWEKVAIFTGLQQEEKVQAVEGWLKEYAISWEECCTMGDDLADYHMLEKAGVAVAPSQAETIIKNISDFVTKREGGNGAVRDLADLILEAKELNPLSLRLK